jgi:hypothetical protein
VALVALSAWGQDQRPLTTGPEPIVGAAVRVHVIASEELEPDVLRALARPNVVLWLTSSSNVIRESSIDTLARFESAFVRVRPPMDPSQLRALARAPRTGLWVDVDRSTAIERARGSRPLAIEFTGAVDDEKVKALLQLKPTFTRWRPPAELDLLAWSRFRSLPGRKVVVVAPGGLLPRDCSQRAATEPAAELHVATLLAIGAPVFPCGAGTRVEIGLETEPWLLKSLVVRDPSVELVVKVDDSVRAVGKVKAILELLGR